MDSIYALEKLINYLERNKKKMAWFMWLGILGVLASWAVAFFYPEVLETRLEVLETSLASCLLIVVWVGTFTAIFCGGYLRLVKPREDQEIGTGIMAGYEYQNRNTQGRNILIAAVVIASLNLILTIAFTAE